MVELKWFILLEVEIEKDIIVLFGMSTTTIQNSKPFFHKQEVWRKSCQCTEYLWKLEVYKAISKELAFCGNVPRLRLDEKRLRL